MNEINADNYIDLQAAVAAAQAAGIPTVKLNPTQTYFLGSTLVIPPEVVIDGGGHSVTSLAPTSPNNRAEIKATVALDPMIKLSNFSSIRGCYINGDNKAQAAILVQDTIYNDISDNLIARCVTAMKFGGALFATIKRNVTTQITGYGLDALKSYASDPNTVYYGLNTGLSESNEWHGDTGCIRIEGILTSIRDDFEYSAFGGSAVITVGGTVQSQLSMTAPYFEIKKGTAPIKVIQINNSSHFSLRDAQGYGDVNDSGAVFLNSNGANTLHISGCFLGRFATMFAGTLLSTSNVSIFGNTYLNTTTVNGFSNLAAADSVLCVWPGQKIGAS